MEIHMGRRVGRAGYEDHRANFPAVPNHFLKSQTTAIEHIHVVIPARNEAEAIADCLAAVAIASSAIPGSMTVTLTLVADRCADATVSRAVGSWAGKGSLRIIEANAGSAGRARDIGFKSASSGADPNLERTWVATTDADSQVPSDWLESHLAYANSGFDGVAGTIDILDWEALPDCAARSYRRMLAEARTADGQHGDVFGANLGIRASALHAVGGFPDVGHGEDHAVWSALRRYGFRLVAPAALVVRTSGRFAGRAHNGLADLLGRLALAQEPSDTRRDVVNLVRPPLAVVPSQAAG